MVAPNSKTPSPRRTRPRPPAATNDRATNHRETPEAQQQQQQQQWQQRDEQGPPPATPHTWRTHMGLEISVEEQAEHLARRLQYATDELIDRLFAYLSQLPEEDDDEDSDDDEEAEADDVNIHGGLPNATRNNTHDRATSGGSSGGGGMTLPASAIGWLSSQYFPPECDGHTVSPTVWSGVALRDRLRLLRFLLPRVTHLRITRQVWPPELPKPQQRRTTRQQSATRRQQEGGQQQDQPQQPSRSTTGQQPPEELNCSVMSVSSALTIDEPHNHATSSAALPTRRAFWDYMQELQNHPHLDMRVFPRIQVLVLESIPPTWIDHLYSLQRSLQVLKWNRACLYSDLPRLFGKGRQQSSTKASNESQRTTPLSPPARIITSPSNNKSRSSKRILLYPKLTHLNLNYAGLGELSSLSKVLAKYCAAPHLECLSLAHNDLVSQAAALSGLRDTTRLVKLNLSYNQLTSLPQAHLYLGGQLRLLQLSHNALTTVVGLDRLYALEELWLDHNCLSDISELAGLCQLPQLEQLHLQGNLSLERDHPFYIKNVWGWFQHYRRATTPLELPQLNGRSITGEQWHLLIQELTAPIFSLSSSYTTTTSPTRYRRVQRKPHSRHTVRRMQGPPLLSAATTAASVLQLTTTATRPTTKATRRRPRKRAQDNQKLKPRLSNGPVSFSLQDVLISLHQEQLLRQMPGEDVSDEVSDDHENKQISDSNVTDVIESNDEYPMSSLDPLEPDDLWSFPLGDIPRQFTELKLSEDGDEEEDIEDTADLTNSESHTTSNDNISQQMTAETPKLANGGKKVTTITLSAPGMTFDAMTADWDEVVDNVARGLIPDGRPRMPVPELAATVNNGREGAFSLEAADLLLTLEASHSPLMMPHAQSISGRSPINGGRGGGGEGGGDDDQSGISPSVGFQSNSLPDLIYPDDASVPSSLGTNRDDFPSRASKFQIAEENAAYDGPDAWMDMNVLENFKLYFEMYVFPSNLKTPSPTDEDEVEEEDYGDGWQTVALRYPRIQLWPEDRRWLESSSPSNMVSATGSSREIDEWTMTREGFVRVWAEDIIPCGKPALRRLAPNRRNRLGFHGDQLYVEGLPDPYAECRKVYLCLSSAAFYIIQRADDVTKKQDERGIKKRFPNPIPDGSKFEDAPWPHAVARHAFQELQTITIGFEFQRLILTFSNPSVRKTDPYVYVLLTSNKKATVSILQDLQRLVKEGKRETIDLSSDAAPVAIENDSQLVLDALQAVIAPEVVGVILHYQVVQQRWKHGERGTVRRVCVVTDTKLYLMDEDYRADSHKPLDPPATGVAALKKKKKQVDLANVSYRKVDEATLKQVSEVQAAGADPKAITIVISPLSRLSRTHRWRLVCRDSVGAERLVEDVRKGMAIAEE